VSDRDPTDVWRTAPVPTLSESMSIARHLERERIIELLQSGEHVWQLDTVQRLFGFKWKQRCRCGFYGVFNNHLIALIKGENK